MAGDGSNTKLTDENRVKIKEAAAIGASAEEMAYFCNVSKQTIYNWFKVDPELFDEIERLRERPVLKARQTIVKALDDPEQAKWFLARKRKKEFSERTEQDLTTKGESLNDMSYARARSIIAGKRSDTGYSEE